MDLNHFREVSLINYPRKISSVLFAQGCNLSCFYCYNKECIPFKEGNISLKKVLNSLIDNKKKINHVVLTGGEPLCQLSRMSFLHTLKHEGFQIKLDTNGSYPRQLKYLLNENVIDFVEMDIKAYPNFERYTGVTGVSNPWDKIIKESVDIIKNSEIEYQFRTVFLPHYHIEEEVSLIKKFLDVPEEKYKVNEYVDKGSKE